MIAHPEQHFIGYQILIMKTYNKRQDLTQTPLFRKYGVSGMRRFYVVWGGFVYLLLVGISGIGLHALTQIGGDRNTWFIVFTAVTLIVAAASLLARMLVGAFRELQVLESQQKTS
jgi:hypothetical protein